MKKTLLTLPIIMLLFSCSDGPSKSEFDKVKSDLEECKKENEINMKIIAELKVTPQQRLEEAKKLFEDKDYSNAKLKYEELSRRYPNTEESKISEKSIKEIEILIEKERLEKEKIKTLGFKVLKEVSSVKVGEVLLNFRSISISKNFVFDRYDDTYHYREAERGSKYIVASVSISSESKYPKLPPVYAYKILDGELKYVETLDYEFARWDDYGSYLGNYSDFRNDFAHTKTIRFELGSQISEEEIKNNPIFIIVGNDNTFERNSERFKNPPISYSRSSYDYKNVLSIEDFKYYTLIKIFNKNLL